MLSLNFLFAFYHSDLIEEMSVAFRQYSEMLGLKNIKWDSTFKNGPNEICGRQLLKNLK